MSPLQTCSVTSLQGNGGSHKTLPITLCEPNEDAQRDVGYLGVWGGTGVEIGHCTWNQPTNQLRIIWSDKQPNKYSQSQSAASKTYTSTVTFGRVPRLENCHAAEGLFRVWLHGLPLTPSVARWLGGDAWTAARTLAPLILCTALDHPEARLSEI